MSSPTASLPACCMWFSVVVLSDCQALQRRNTWRRQTCQSLATNVSNLKLTEALDCIADGRMQFCTIPSVSRDLPFIDLTGMGDTLNPWLSIIVPVLNEASSIAIRISRIRGLESTVGGLEIIVVDGKSKDGSADCAKGADLVLSSNPGRATQMNHGARHARGDVLLFLHADTDLPDSAMPLIKSWWNSGGQWGAFHVIVEGRSSWLKAVSAGINLRSRLTGIVTGDQAIYLTRATFDDEDGYAEIPLMEDVELSGRLRRRSWPHLIRQPARTSGRRWDQHGVFRTIVFMWGLRFAYFLGRDPGVLAERYYPNTDDFKKSPDHHDGSFP